MGRKVLLILDGAADQPVDSLGGKTPIEAANIPHMDKLASQGFVGMTETVPAKFVAASDVANLSLLGHDPDGIYTGRGPLEAAAMGVTIQPDEIAFRVNTISINDDDDDETLKDYSAGHITTEESGKIIESSRELFSRFHGAIHPGMQYRHLMTRKDCLDTETFAPHDNIGRALSEIKPKGLIGEIVDASRELLKDHPVNVARREAGKNTVDALWPWGQGRAITLPPLGELYKGAKGSLVSAVDLIRGIGILAGFRILQVEGITGYYDTNYAGKGQAAIEALKSGDDICIVHVESPDEAGHEKLVDEKIRAIENIDKYIVGPLVEAIPNLAIIGVPDHPTHVATGLHGSEAVPYFFTDLAATTDGKLDGPEGYGESHTVGDPVIATSLLPKLMNLPN